MATAALDTEERGVMGYITAKMYSRFSDAFREKMVADVQRRCREALLQDGCIPETVEVEPPHFELGYTMDNGTEVPNRYEIHASGLRTRH